MNKYKVGQFYLVSNRLLNHSVGNIIEITNVEEKDSGDLKVSFVTVFRSPKKFKAAIEWDSFLAGSPFCGILDPISATTKMRMVLEQKLKDLQEQIDKVNEDYLKEYERYLEQVFIQKENGYNGRVICVENEQNFYYFTVGKTYEVINGVLYDNEGDPSTNIYVSIAELNYMEGAKFIPAVE